MSRRVAEFDDNCLEATHDIDIDPCAIQLRPQVFGEMRDQGYPIESVETLYTNVSLKEDGNKGYIVGQIETLSYPLDIADAAKDSCEIWFCTCPGWNFHHNKRFPTDERPTDVNDCPHVERVKRKERVSVDDENQTELGGVADD